MIYISLISLKEFVRGVNVFLDLFFLKTYGYNLFQTALHLIPKMELPAHNPCRCVPQRVCSSRKISKATSGVKKKKKKGKCEAKIEVTEVQGWWLSRWATINCPCIHSFKTWSVKLPGLNQVAKTWVRPLFNIAHPWTVHVHKLWISLKN